MQEQGEGGGGKGKKSAYEIFYDKLDTIEEDLDLYS